MTTIPEMRTNKTHIILAGEQNSASLDIVATCRSKHGIQNDRLLPWPGKRSWIVGDLRTVKISRSRTSSRPCGQMAMNMAIRYYRPLDIRVL
jgi:hypothetical protein